MLFQGDGMIQEDELEDVLRACLQESGMTLPDSDIQALAWALIDEALEEEDENSEEINIDQLRNVLVKHEGLVENLTIRLTITFFNIDSIFIYDILSNGALAIIYY